MRKCSERAFRRDDKLDQNLFIFDRKVYDFRKNAGKETHEGDWIDYSDERESEDIQILRKSLPKLGEKCQEILNLFYFKEYNLDEITKLMKYDNKNVAKSQKSRCIKQLKDIISSIQNE